MDSMEAKSIKSGFSAINENLTDIAKSIRKLTTYLLLMFWIGMIIAKKILQMVTNIRRFQ